MLLVGKRYAFALQKSTFWSAKNRFFGSKKPEIDARSGHWGSKFTTLNRKFSLSARFFEAKKRALREKYHSPNFLFRCLYIVLKKICSFVAFLVYCRSPKGEAGNKNLYIGKAFLTLCSWRIGIWQFQISSQDSKQRRRSWVCNIRQMIADSHYWFHCSICR